MQKNKKNFNIYFENKDLAQNENYSLTIVKSLIRSVLEPMTNNNSKALIFMHLKEYSEIEGVIKRLEYNNNIYRVVFNNPYDCSKFNMLIKEFNQNKNKRAIK